MAMVSTELFEDKIEIASNTSFEKISLITPSTKGVIFFADQNNKPVQLITAANIRRAVRSKLFRENQQEKSRKTDLTEIVRYVYYRKTYCDFETGLWHYRSAKEIYPDSYSEQIFSYRPSYIKFDATKNWPVFSIIDNPIQTNKSNIFGPFATRKECKLHLDTLIEAFTLCKNLKCLDNPEKAKSCPYLQMGTCDGVCVDQIPKEEYIQRIQEANASLTDRDIIERTLRNKMKNLSKEMKFEQAQSVKNTLEDFAKKQGSLRWPCKLDELSVLHIDQSKKIKIKGQKKHLQTFAAFLFKSENIYQLENFDLDGIGKLLATTESIKPLPESTMDDKQKKEQLALMSYYLYKSNRPGIWLNWQKSFSKEKLEYIIKKHFDL